jgi:lysophospholipase L1-like esterase
MVEYNGATTRDYSQDRPVSNISLKELKAQIATKPASTMATWNRKRTLSQLNQAPARIICIGDSTTAGVYSDSYTTAIGSTDQHGPNSYPAQLVNRFNAAGLKSEYSFALPGKLNNLDPRWALDANWSYSAFFAGNAACIQSTVANAVLTLTPGVVADSYRVLLWSNTANTVSLQATGGSSNSVDTVALRGAGSVSRLYYSPVVTASSASASNTLTITNVSGTALVAGVEYWNSASPNTVRVMNLGVGNSRATDWSNSGNAGSLNLISTIAPDLTIISLGINDGSAANPLDTVLTSIKAIADRALQTGDVLLMSAVPHSFSSILDSYNAAYKQMDYPYVDIQQRWSYSGQTLQFLTTDGTHPNAIGYGDIATIVAQTLLST